MCLDSASHQLQLTIIIPSKCVFCVCLSVLSSVFIVHHLMMMMMMMMPTLIYALQLCLLRVPLLAVCFYLALQRFLWCISPMSTLTSFAFYTTVYSALSAIIVLPPFLSLCPNRVSRRFLIFWTSDSSCCNILRIVSFLILSLLVSLTKPVQHW